MENYDEDLTENQFFQILQTDHIEVFRKATIEGWIICVPRAGSVPKYALTHEDFFGHILIPSDELPESHFRTLNDKEVRILNRVITIEHDDISRPHITHILFEETFYNEDLKYKVLCVDNPLERSLNLSGLNDSSNFLTINTLRDSIDLLWTECGGLHILERIDHCIKNFCACNENFEFEALQVQKDLLKSLYVQCLQMILHDSRLRERTALDKHLLENVKLSVETYMHHGIYRSVIKGITACTAIEDSHLNKIIRNLSDIQLRDLGIRADLFNAVPWAKQELARIDCYSTVLGKIGCLKRMVTSISQPNVGEIREMNISDAISADDLLPIIVFLVIKTGLPNWNAHLTYMKEFHFSASITCGVDEHSFLITSLEAAIEHIKSGVLLGPVDPESQIGEDETFCNVTYKTNSDVLKITDKEQNGEISCEIGYFFDQIRLGNVDCVREILEKKDLKSETLESKSLQLCHPLCSCDKCESTLSKHMCDMTPTINSCDDRGFSPLHVACLFGQPAVVDLLVNYGANVNATDYSSSTPLHYAAAKGHQNAVLLMLHSKCNIQAQDNDGNTPLHLASNNGHDGCVKALLYFAEHNGCNLDVNCINNLGETPLHHASRWGYEGIVQILLDYGGHPYFQNKRHLTPLDLAHSFHISQLLTKELKTPCFEAFKSVSKNDFKVGNSSVAAASKKTLDMSEDNKSIGSFFAKSRKSQSGYRPQSTDQMRRAEKVLRAIALGDTRLACFYLGLEDSVQEYGINVIGDVKSYCHPLCTCEKCRPNEILVMNPKKNKIEKKSLNVNVCNTEGFTPLHVAAMHGRKEMVRLLLDSGALTNVCTRSKHVTPLHLACQNQRLSVVDLLLQTKDCDINVQDFRGNTPLHYACYTNNLMLIKSILRHDPLLNLKNVNGKTPREEAEDSMALTMVHLLKNAETILQHSS